MLAAVGSLGTTYRSVNSYPHLAVEGIEGNPERLSDAELASAARGILDGLYRAQIAEWHALYAARANEDRATADIARAARAATFGGVAHLLVDMDQTVHGTVDEADGRVVLADSAGADTYGVADEIARRVLASGGHVLAVRAEDMPESGTPVAAILRWAF